MLFNSYIFIFIFLPIVLFGYYLLNKVSINLSNCFVVLMSLWFYGYFNYKYLLIIITSVLINYAISRLIYKYKHNIYIAKWLLFLGVAVNLIIIFYFKYYNFFIQNINKIFSISISTRDILLPLGISFFTFQQISFIVDSYKEDVSNYTFLEYAMFVTYFPQLIAGPIVLHNELIPQFRDKNLRKFNSDNLAMGIYIFVFGFCKKVLIADNLNLIVTWLFANVGSAKCMDVIIGMFAYVFQLYFDFSGYCDMALGIAKMFNFNLPINFDSPFKSLSVVDLWKRWHISLGRFLMRYVYIPLGGNKKGKFSTYMNMFITFVLSGLWHGANWTFILWGVLNGIVQILTIEYKKIYNKLHFIIRWLLTFIFINFSWLLFRSNSIKEWKRLCGKIVKMKGGLAVSNSLIESFEPARKLSYLLKMFSNKEYVFFDVISIFIIFGILLFICLFFENNYKRSYKFSISTAVIVSLLFILCVSSLSNVTVFLYFNF